MSCSGCAYLYDEVPEFIKPCNCCYSEEGESMYMSVEDFNELDLDIKLHED